MALFLEGVACARSLFVTFSWPESSFVASSIRLLLAEVEKEGQVVKELPCNPLKLGVVFAYVGSSEVRKAGLLGWVHSLDMGRMTYLPLRRSNPSKHAISRISERLLSDECFDYPCEMAKKKKKVVFPPSRSISPFIAAEASLVSTNTSLIQPMGRMVI
ncbi:hypothetical protein MPH_05504 [Macrophomina phaseolina MS6]|uniref:Uncharacterized protein n=1 Tax=Macrophomina phaseolina (strain MS6) TaxID=1126212 RepID=K2S438_MACPH|nr:hypothetical protein MPH_05504 [Macrophomina phaseolina MS6]